MAVVLWLLPAELGLEKEGLSAGLKQGPRPAGDARRPEEILSETSSLHSIELFH